MITRMEHTALTVANMERSIEFYTKIMGLTVKRIIESPPEMGLGRINGLEGCSARIAHMTKGDFMLELFEFQSPDGRPIGDRNQADHGFVHMGFGSTDVPGDLAKLDRLGYHCLGEPVEYRPGVWVAYFYGPDGEVLELRQAPEGD